MLHHEEHKNKLQITTNICK